MPEAEMLEELQALHINMLSVMQIRSKRQVAGTEKYRTLTDGGKSVAANLLER
jgi:hypothetical protein